MRKIPPLHLILAFDAVVRKGSFIQAADELSLSGSTVSHRIRELERLLGVSLFHRTTRSLSLTGDGARLYAILREPLNTLERAFAEITPQRHVIRISALPSFARFRLLPELGSFRALHPGISIEVSSTTRTVNVDQGDADIALRFSQAEPVAYVCEKLLSDEWFPVAAPEYLRQLGTLKIREIFQKADFLSHTRQPWDTWLLASGMKMTPQQKTFTFSDTGFMLDATLGLQGIGLARRSLVHNLLKQGRLVRVSDVSIPAEQSYYLLASERTAVSKNGEIVMDWIRSLVQHG